MKLPTEQMARLGVVYKFIDFQALPDFTDKYEQPPRGKTEK